MLGWLGIGLQAAGTALSFFGEKEKAESAEEYYEDLAAEEKRVAEANKEISLYDASVAEKDAYYEEQATALELALHYRQVEQVLGTQAARYAKSGVVISSDSPLDTMMQTVSDGIRDAEIIANNGLTAAARKRSLAARYRLLAEKGLRDAAAQAHLLEKAGAAEKTGYMYSAFGKLAEGVYNISYQLGY
jgi:hypothetical protein